MTASGSASGLLPRVLKRQLDATKALERVTGRIIPRVFWRKGGPGVRRPGQQPRGFYKAWRTAREAAGVPKRLHHDFRRTAVRKLERAGLPRSAAMEMVGHKTGSIYRRYAIANEGMLRQAAVKLSALHRADRLAR